MSALNSSTVSTTVSAGSDKAVSVEPFAMDLVGDEEYEM
jgi:hypothetical protein